MRNIKYQIQSIYMWSYFLSMGEKMISWNRFSLFFIELMRYFRYLLSQNPIKKQTFKIIKLLILLKIQAILIFNIIRQNTFYT